MHEGPTVDDTIADALIISGSEDAVDTGYRFIGITKEVVASARVTLSCCSLRLI
jgi:hypothetical protein